MAGEVKQLRAEPVAGVVNLLEEKLEQARNGQIRAVAVVAVTQGCVIGTAWERGDAGTYLHELTAGSAYLHHRIVASAVGED